MLYIADAALGQMHVDSCNGRTGLLSFAYGVAIPYKMPLRPLGQVLLLEYTKVIVFDALSVLAADTLSCNAKVSTLVRWGSGLYLADAWRLMSIAAYIHCHRRTRGACYTTPVSKAVSHGGSGIHLAWEGTTGEISPPISSANKPLLTACSFRTTVNSCFFRNFFGGSACSSLHSRLRFFGSTVTQSATCFQASSCCFHNISWIVGVPGTAGDGVSVAVGGDDGNGGVDGCDGGVNRAGGVAGSCDAAIAGACAVAGGAVAPGGGGAGLVASATGAAGACTGAAGDGATCVADVTGGPVSGRPCCWNCARYARCHARNSWVRPHPWDCDGMLYDCPPYCGWYPCHGDCPHCCIAPCCTGCTGYAGSCCLACACHTYCAQCELIGGRIPLLHG